MILPSYELFDETHKPGAYWNIQTFGAKMSLAFNKTHWKLFMSGIVYLSNRPKTSIFRWSGFMKTWKVPREIGRKLDNILWNVVYRYLR